MTNLELTERVLFESTLAANEDNVDALYAALYLVRYALHPDEPGQLYNALTVLRGILSTNTIAINQNKLSRVIEAVVCVDSHSDCPSRPDAIALLEKINGR